MEVNNNEKEQDQNKEIMEAWSLFLKNLHNKSTDDKEKVFHNILQVIKELSSQNIFSREEIEGESEKYFLGTFLGDLIKAVLQDNPRDQDVRQIEQEIIEVLVKEFITNMENPKLIPFFENLVNIFSEEHNFYKNKEGEDASEVFVIRINQILNPDGYAWRNSLEEGSLVDFLKRDTLSTESALSRSVGIASWTRAEIISMDENKNVNLRLLGTGQIAKDISLYSSCVLPFNTLSLDFDWREELKEGDEIDFLDNKSWYRSTVLQAYDKLSTSLENPEQVRKYIKYGLRVYRENGRLEDSQKRKYIGWTESFDREISVHDPKVRRPNEFSKIISNSHLITSYPIDSRKFNEIETFVPFEINTRRFYMIPKKMDNKLIDYLYYSLINQFCEDNSLLDKMISTMQSKSVNYDIFAIIVDIIYNIHPFLHIKFSQNFLKEFISISLTILKRFSLQEVRNFKRDKFETIIKRLKDIMIRVYIDVDANVIFDLFGVEFGLNCLRSSSILDKKLLGLKILTETLADATRGSASSSIGFSDKHLSPPFLMAKVFQEDENGNTIFDILYGSQSHSQILQKSTDLLKTFFVGRVLTPKEVNRLFQIIKDATDNEIKNVIYKGIQQNATHMGLELQIFILRKLIDIPADKLTQLDLDLLISTFKALPSYGNKDVIPALAKHFFDLVFTKASLLNVKLYENVVDEFVSLLKTHEFRDVLVEYVTKIAELLSDESFDFIRVLKTLRKLLQSLINVIEDSKKERLINVLLGNNSEPIEDSESDTFTIISSPNNKNIIDLTLNFLNEYHKNCKSYLENNEIPESKKESFIFDISSSKRVNATPHSEIVNEVTAFFSLFINIKDFSLGNDHINLLYQIYVQNCISHKDANIFFKWLKEAEDKKAIPIGAFELIFGKMVESKDLEFSNISLDLFNCLWNIFTTINKNSGKLRIDESRGEASQAYSGVSNAGQTLLSYSYNSDKKNEFDLKCLVSNPLELTGIELIWKLVISCSNSGEVNKTAVDNFLKLFLGIDLEAEMRGEVWNLLMEKCISTIKHIEQINSSNKSEKKLKIVNCLNILKALIEETEKKGTAGCISHSSILRNSILTIKICNYITDKERNNTPDKNFTLRVFSNTTIWDLKKLIGKTIGVIPELIKFLSSGTGSREITDNDHGKTLSDLRVKDNDTMTVVRNPILDKIPKVPLVKDGKLADKALKVFAEIFERFSTDGLMSREQCALFTTCAIDSLEVVAPDDKRIRDAFEVHDLDRDDFLTLEDFNRFYFNSIVELKKPNVVWENLKSFNYRNDLKKLNEPLDEYNTLIKVMPRFVLSKNQEFFNTIFELQDEEESLAREASKFLSVICTNPIIYRDILMIASTPDWNLYLDSTNYYKLLYSLQIIESFFEEFDLGEQNVDTEALEFTILEEIDRELLLPNHKLAWIEKFLTQNGVKHIIENVFLKSSLKSNTQYKKCLNLTLKVVKSSLSLLFRARNSKNKKDEVILLIRKNSVTPESALNEEDKKAIDEIFLENSNDKKNDTNDAKDTSSINNKKKNELENSLIEIINNYYGDSVIHHIDFGAIVHKLISNSYEIVKKPETDAEERTLVNNSINLLSLIIVSQDDISSFLNDNIYNLSFESANTNKTIDLAEFIISGLLYTNILTKLNFQKTFASLSNSLCNLKEYSFTFKLFNILNNKITHLTSYEKEQSRYFFELFQTLLDKCIKLPNEETIDYEELAINIVDILTAESNSIVEELIAGYMKILNVILSNKDSKFKAKIGVEKNLINVLIEEYLIKDAKFSPNEFFNLESQMNLIDPDDEKYRKMSNIQSFTSCDCRQVLFNLLLNLVGDNAENLSKMFSASKWTDINLYTSKVKKERKFYNPSQDKRSLHGFIGLKNLQCICYMLAVLQQFFNVPTFRYAIMQAIDNKKPNITEDVDDNILHQLQKMFVYMELSNRNEYNPADFCYAFKGIDGLPTNVCIQQDSQEFLGRLFDIGEHALKDTDYKYLFQSVFLGKTCSQVICKGGCGKVRNTFEDFYNLSLEVLNRNSLRDSLEKFISEDKIDDYNCDTCKKKVSVVKRTSFAELPNVLIVHLQRLYFNYESLMNEKINSRLEFPKRMNLKEFCTETITKDEEDKTEDDRVYNKEESYYQYELVGVVVHLGVAEAGHYYSYINVKRDGSGDTMSYNPNDENDLKNWLTFNDSSVTAFQLNNLEEDCFGGVSNSNSDQDNNNNNFMSIWNGPNSKNKDNGSENSKNAYMLVYERVKKSPLKMTMNNANTEQFPKDKPVVTFNDANKVQVIKQFDVFSQLDNKSDDVSLDCENTAISRRGNSELNQSIYNHIFFNESSNEYTYYIPFYSLKRVIPANYFYDVTIDNLWFTNDQKIYSQTFANFLEKLLESIVKLAKQNKSNLDYEFVAKLFSTMTKFLLEIISKSNFRDNLKKLIDHVNELIKIYPEFSNYILEYIFENKERLVNEIIFSSEESANLAYKNLILCALVENFKQHAKEIDEMLSYDTNNDTLIPSIMLLDYLYSLMPSEASKQWTRILAFLELFDGLAKAESGLVLDYMFKKETIFRLADFMMGRESPYFSKGESRNDMGNKIAPPKFFPLINVISHLVRSSYTETWTEEDLNEGLMPHTLVKNLAKVHTLSEREKECINKSIFYKKAIASNFNNVGISKILGHLLYNNYTASKYRIFMIIEAINESITPGEAKNAFDLLYNILLIEDKYTRVRLEWIFGIPQINIKTYESPSLILRDTKFGEKIIKYISPLNYGTSFDSLTEKTLTKYQASADFISILNYLFASVMSKRHILEYFESLPHPRKDNMLLRDYLFYLANEEIDRIEGVQTLKSKLEKPVKGMRTIISTYEAKKTELLGEEQHKLKFAPRYKYGNITREHISNVPDDAINIYNVHCLAIDYDVEIFFEGQQLESFVVGNKENKENKEDKEEEEHKTKIVEDYTDKKFKECSKKTTNDLNIVTDEDYDLDYTIIKQKTIDREMACIDEENVHNISNEAVQGDDDNSDNNVKREIDVIDLTVGDNSPKEEEKNSKIVKNKFVNNDGMENSRDIENNENLKNVEFSQKSVGEYPPRRTKKSNSDEKVENFLPKPQSGYNANTEENYIRNNLSDILDNEVLSRSFTHKLNQDSSTNKIVVNAIRRYIIFNDSGKEYKVRINFSASDDFVNTYIPSSEIVVYAKKNSLVNVHTFLKEDIDFPWSEIEVRISSEDHEDSVNNDYSPEKDSAKAKKNVKKSQSYDNLKTADPKGPIELPPAEKTVVPNQEVEVETSFDITCEKCGYSNVINPNNPNYSCQKCKKDLFG